MSVFGALRVWDTWMISDSLDHSAVQTPEEWGVLPVLSWLVHEGVEWKIVRGTVLIRLDRRAILS